MKKWLDKYNDDVPQAQNGIEGTMGGLTDQGFNYNGAWGGTMQMGGKLTAEQLESLNKAKMRSKMALASEFGNPSAKRMTSVSPPSYRFSGNEMIDGESVGVRPGETGTHFMSSMGEYAVPYIQEGPNGKLRFNSNASFRDREAIRFDNPKDAEYFAKHYKEVAPMMRQYAMGGNLPGSVGFMYARTQNPAPSNGPYAKKTKASAQNGRAVSDNTRLKPIVTEKPINREVVKSTEPFKSKDNRSVFSNSRAKERGDELWDISKKATAIGQFSPEPISRTTAIALNSLMGAADTYFSLKDNDTTNATINAIGAIPLPGYSSVKALRNMSGLTGRQKSNILKSAAGVLGVDLFGVGADLTGNFDYEKKQNGGEMKFYQEGLDWKPKNISQDGSEIPQAQLGIGILPTTEQYQKFAENVGEVLSAPQKALTKLISGKYQKPSEAMDIQNKAGAFVTDLILDPVNILAGAKVAKGVDDMIYPTRTYRAQVPGKNVLGYESSDLSKKVYEKGDWTTKDLDEAFQYLKGVDMPGGRPGLITGEDMLLTEYKVPFWKKSVKFDEDVVALKETQRQSVNPNEYIVPRNRFLYPRKTTSLKAVPEHLKQDKFYSASAIPLSKESYQYRSAPYMYVQDQLDAAVRGKKYKKGGEIKKDDMGYWNPENWGEPVEIGSNQITMEGVYEPLIGISDTGDVQYMEPGGEYEFDGESVIEYPIAQSGKKIKIPMSDFKKMGNSYLDSVNTYDYTQALWDAVRTRNSSEVDQAISRNKNLINNTSDVKPTSYDNVTVGSKNYRIPSYKYPEMDPWEKYEPVSGFWDNVGYKLSDINNAIGKTNIGKSLQNINDKLESGVKKIWNKFTDDYVKNNVKNQGALSTVNKQSVPLKTAPAAPPVVSKSKPKPKPKPIDKPNPKPNPKPISKSTVESKKEQPVKKEQPKPVERKQNIYEGSPVYSPGIGSGLPSALIGFANQKGDTTYIKPEDYERFAVPKYAKEYIETKKQKNGGWLDKYN